MEKDEKSEFSQRAQNRRLILGYTQYEEIIGLLVLSALGFYAIRLVASFRTGALAKSWKQVTVGSIFLLLAQIPFLASGMGLFGGQSLLISIGTLMRFVGIVFIIIGLRTQSRVWTLENKSVAHRSDQSGAYPTIDRP